MIAGEGESRPDLERLIAALGVSNRVTLLGRMSDEVLVDHLARCRFVCFPPVDEDYGFVTVEAFASRKGVITCVDSGGPAELVRDGETGLVCDPTPASMAAAIARVMDDAGVCGAAWRRRRHPRRDAHVATVTWPGRPG